jgi:hypothetical protein
MYQKAELVLPMLMEANMERFKNQQQKNPKKTRFSTQSKKTIFI